MNGALVFDTETTGLPDWHAPSESPDQPHIVQLAAMLVDLDTRETISSMDVIIKPDGWTIPDDVAAIHGITTERALEVGIPEASAVALFLGLWNGRTVIGHNVAFDQRILRIALKRNPETFSETIVERWKDCRAECTQKLATPILKLPPTAKMRAAGRFHNKSANLNEAHEFFIGSPVENAHSAMADVQACWRVYCAIQDMQKEKAA